MTHFSKCRHIQRLEMYNTGSTPVTPTNGKTVDITEKTVVSTVFIMFLVLNIHNQKCVFRT